MCFFFCSISYTGLPKGRTILLTSASQRAKTKLAPVRPCVRFWGQGRETTPGKPQTGPVEAVWGCCERAGQTQQTQDRRCPAPPPLGGGVNSFWGEKPNLALCGDFWPVRGRGREQHQQSHRPALLKPCEQQLPRQLPREALGYEVSVFSCGKVPGFSALKSQRTKLGGSQPW